MARGDQPVRYLRRRRFRECGSFLTYGTNIGDGSPDPLQMEPGQASYAIVGVQYEGRQRFGRQSVGGGLTVRGPTVFPSYG